ncbi:MAG: hypothetical protein R6V01_04220 [Thermoplasmatota archaeon]
MNFRDLFETAVGSEPFDYQSRLAQRDELPQIVDIPTGCGKTAAAVLSWVWRRRYASDEIRKRTPKRLVYCLPIGSIENQTRNRCFTVVAS